MASIHRKSFTKADGETGKRIKAKSAKWYVTYKDADGIRRCVPGFKDKTATTQYANKLEREAELGRAGVRDQFAIHRKRQLTEHLAAFEAHLVARKITGDQIKLLKTRCQKILAGCSFAFIADLSPSAVDGYLAGRAHSLFAPVVDYLREAGEARSCSEIENYFKRHFDVSHVTTACEYLADQGVIGKVSIPARLTKKSNADVQELAFVYLADAAGPPGDEEWKPR